MAKVLESWIDIKENDYDDFLDMAIDWFGFFSLVWLDSRKFDDSAAQIKQDLRNHEICRRRATHWPGTRYMQNADTPKADIITFRLDVASRKILARPKSLFSWREPAYLEDLAFYKKDGQLGFATSSHESIAWAVDTDFGWSLPKRLDFTDSKSDEDGWKNYTAYGDGAVKL
ncbi:MAG: hypothetical protein WDN00_08985 [Limisphaerales bacterium]